MHECSVAILATNVAISATDEVATFDYDSDPQKGNIRHCTPTDKGRTKEAASGMLVFVWASFALARVRGASRRGLGTHGPLWHA